MSDRTAELKTLEEVHDRMAAEVDGLRKSERTRGVVSGAFQDSLGVLRSHEQTKARREGLGIEVDDSIPEPREGSAPGGSAAPALKDIDELDE